MFNLIFGPIIALVKTIAGGVMQNVKAKQTLKAAVVTRKLEMIASQQTYNEQWELAALADSDRFIKRLSFLLLSAPMITAIFAPQATQLYITHTLATLPTWYTTSYMAMLSSIWAVKSLQTLRGWKHGKETSVQKSKPQEKGTQEKGTQVTIGP